MDSGIALVGLAALGFCAYQMTKSSLTVQAKIASACETAPKETGGWAEPSNEVVDPTLFVTNPNRHPVVSSDVGPFGLDRFVHHDVGGHTFTTFGPSGDGARPGLWTL